MHCLAGALFKLSLIFSVRERPLTQTHACVTLFRTGNKQQTGRRTEEEKDPTLSSYLYHTVQYCVSLCTPNFETVSFIISSFVETRLRMKLSIPVSASLPEERKETPIILSKLSCHHLVTSNILDRRKSASREFWNHQ